MWFLHSFQSGDKRRPNIGKRLQNLNSRIWGILLGQPQQADDESCNEPKHTHTHIHTHIHTHTQHKTTNGTQSVHNVFRVYSKTGGKTKGQPNDRRAEKRTGPNCFCRNNMFELHRILTHATKYDQGYIHQWHTTCLLSRAVMTLEHPQNLKANKTKETRNIGLPFLNFRCSGARGPTATSRRRCCSRWFLPG